MCGIISVLSCFKNDNISSCLIDSLERLEYRGYDSAGIAIIKDDSTSISTIKSVGRIKNLKEKASQNNGNLDGHIGIGHTRWATHGKVTELNAHPHVSKDVAIVHNGIIENYEEIKSNLIKNGYNFESETDSEVISQLILFYMEKKELSFFDAFKETISLLKGTYAIVAICKKEPNILLGSKKGSPMAIGTSEDKKNVFVASDAVALSGLSKQIVYLEEQDTVYCELKDNTVFFKVFDKNFEEIQRKEIENTVSLSDVTKNGFEDYMLKEIYEEPLVALNTYQYFNNTVDIKKYKKLCFIACGTSYYAGILAKYWIEDIAQIPVDVEIASEFRYRNPVLSKDSLYVFISQSGETIDTLCAMRNVIEKGADTLSIVNVDKSSIERESKYTILTRAGVEMGVASTKAFISQILSLVLLVVDKNNIDITEIVNSMTSVIHKKNEFEQLAKNLSEMKTILYIGRGTSYPVSLEGSLKMKEISYISSIGCPAGEIKHGPIALVDENVCTVILAPNDRYFEKTISNAQEILARNGKLLILTSEDKLGSMKSISENKNVYIFTIPEMKNDVLSPFPLTTAVHFLAYHTAKFKGLDVDKPRNLAKSVTVE